MVAAGTHGPNITTNGLKFTVDSLNPRSFTNNVPVWIDPKSSITTSLNNIPRYLASNGTLLFNGTSDYAVNNSVTFDYSSGGSVEVWLCLLEDVTPNGQVLFSHQSPNGKSMMRLSAAPEGFIRFEISSNKDVDTATVNIDSQIEVGQWTQLLGTFGVLPESIDGNTVVTLYKDAKLQNFIESYPNKPTTISGPLYIASNGITNYTSAIYWMVRVYESFLTPEDVLVNYNAIRGRLSIGQTRDGGPS